MQQRQTHRSDFSRVLSAHPDKAALVRTMLLKDPSFRDMCEDYLTVLDIIAAFDLDAAPGQKGALEEYDRLGIELECEIARALSRSTEKSGI